MICVMELQCMDWEHEHVNAGFLRLLRNAAVNEKIVLYSTKKHAERLNHLYCLSEHNIDIVTISIPDKKDCDEVLMGSYLDIIKDMIDNNYRYVRTCFLLSASGSIISAVRQLVGKSHLHFFLVFHSRLERELLGRNELQSIYSLRNVMDAVRESSIDYICYSPMFPITLKGVLQQEIIEKIHFLHHPVVPNKSLDLSDHTAITLGIYGSALKESAGDLIEMICSHEELSPKIQ